MDVIAHPHIAELPLIGKSLEYPLLTIQSIQSLTFKLTQEDLADRNVLYQMYLNLEMWQAQLAIIERMIFHGRYPPQLLEIFTCQYSTTGAVEFVDYPGYGFPFEQTTNLYSVSVTGGTLANLDGLWAKTSLTFLCLDVDNVDVMQKYSNEIVSLIQNNPLAELKFGSCNEIQLEAAVDKGIQKFVLKGQSIERREATLYFGFTTDFALTADELNVLSAAAFNIGAVGDITKESLQTTVWPFFTQSERNIVDLLSLNVGGQLCTLNHISSTMKKLEEHTGVSIALLKVNYKGDFPGRSNFGWALTALRTRYNVASIYFHLGDKGDASFEFESMKKDAATQILRHLRKDDVLIYRKVNQQIIETINKKLGINDKDTNLAVPPASDTPSLLRSGRFSDTSSRRSVTNKPGK